MLRITLLASLLALLSGPSQGGVISSNGRVINFQIICGLEDGTRIELTPQPHLAPSWEPREYSRQYVGLILTRPGEEPKAVTRELRCLLPTKGDELITSNHCTRFDVHGAVSLTVDTHAADGQVHFQVKDPRTNRTWAYAAEAKACTVRPL